MNHAIPRFVINEHPNIPGRIFVGITVPQHTQHGGNRIHNKRHPMLAFCGGIHLRRIVSPLAVFHRLTVQQHLLHAVGVGDHPRYAALHAERRALESHDRPAVFNPPAHIAPHIPVSVVHIGEDRAVFTDKVRRQTPHHSLCIIQGRARNIVIK